MAFPQTSTDSLMTASGDTIVRRDSLNPKPGVFRFSDEEEEEEAETEDTAGTQVAAPLEGHGLFKGHALQPVHRNAQPVDRAISDWFTITLLALIVFFTWFRSLYFRIFRQLFAAFFNITTTNQIVRDESVLLQKASLILSVISYLLIGLFLYQLSVIAGWEVFFPDSGFMRFLFFSICVAAAYSIKMVALRFLSAVFDMERPVALYIFNIFLMVMMTGLLLLPANIILAYTPSAEVRLWTLYISSGIIAALFLYRLVRATGIWTGIPHFPFFYLFLYFCTFEIAPLLILWKILSA